MPQRSSLLPFLALAALLGACQDYNFSPVKYAVIQPGTERVTLSEISTADILFVVDDSGSMGLKQQKLAASFDAFVESLKTSNEARVTAQLAPIDFHIAVTTTSVFLNAPTTSSCSASCGGAAGQQVCCDSVSSLPLQVIKGCATSAECSTGNTCRADCLGRGGELTCCTGAGAQPERANQACPALGQPCGQLQDRYVVPRSPRLCGGGLSCAVGPSGGAGPAPAGYSCRTDCLGLAGASACCSDTSKVSWRDETCTLGTGTEGGLYPRGDFVRAGSNPRVLHFTKALFCPPAVAPATGCGPRDDAAIAALVQQFKDNVKVGTCGSGQEQGMEAAKRALQKALRLGGLKQPDDVALAEWPQRDATDSTKIGKTKLVVVWVGDEDDCSGPEDPNKGVIFAVSGTDACVLDALKDPAEQRLYTVQSYRDFLTSLGQPVAGAFIVSAVGSPCAAGAECRALCGRDTCPNNCVDGACRADLCASSPEVDPYCAVDPSGQLTCGGVAPGTRFLSLSAALGAKGADTVAGSVCQAGEPATAPFTAVPPAFSAANAGFSSILKRVAEVVKQPAGLSLPTQPASSDLTVLRIVGRDGQTRKTCYGPAKVGTTQAAAQAAVPPWDWWFTGADETNRIATGPSRFVYINRATGSCTADAGETYSADYLGLVPAGGCAGPADCQAALGATVDDWKCQVPAGSARGTCVYSSTN